MRAFRKHHHRDLAARFTTGAVVDRLDDTVDQATIGRQAAHRIRAGRVPGDEPGLTSATAEVLVTLRTAPARLLHPLRAAKPVERRRLVPDPGKPVFGHLGKIDAGEPARALAGQGGAVGGDAEKYPPPAVHARLRAIGVVVRDHVEDFHAVAMRRLVPVRDRLRAFQLLAGGKELVPVVERPAVVLRVGELHVIRPEIQRHVQNRGRVVDVVPVEHDVEHHRIALLLDRTRHLDLVGKGIRASEMVVERRVARLEADLDVVEARVPEPAHAVRVHPDRRGDEIGVVAEGACLRDQVFEVTAYQGFSPGEAELHRAELPALTQGVDPLLRGQLTPCPGEVDRVRAVRTLQRAGVGKLREQPQRPGWILGQGQLPNGQRVAWLAQTGNGSTAHAAVEPGTAGNPLRPQMPSSASAVADVHRDLEPETHLGEIRLGPHDYFLRDNY